MGSVFNILLLGIIFTSPFFLMNVYSCSVYDTGIFFLVVAVFIAIGSLLSGNINQKYEFFALYSIITMLLVVILAVILTEDHTLNAFIVLYSFLGLLLGLANSLALIASQSRLPKERVGFGSGLFKMVTTLMGALGVVVIGTIISEPFAEGDSIQVLNKEIAVMILAAFIFICLKKAIIEIRIIKIFAC